MLRCKEQEEAGIAYNPTTVPTEWKAHDPDPTQCTTCQRYGTAMKGGRPAKQAKLADGSMHHKEAEEQANELVAAAPEDDSTQCKESEQQGDESLGGIQLEADAVQHEESEHTDIICYIQSMAPTGHKPLGQDTLAISQFIRPLPPLSLSDFQCYACKGVFDRPVQLNCSHITCMECLLQNAQSSQVVKCPKCAFLVSEASHIQPPHSIILHSLGSLQVLCTCRKILSLGQYANHAANCRSEVDITKRQSVTPIRKAALQREFLVPITKTPTSLERKAASHTVRRMIHSSSQHATSSHLRIHTGGQVCRL